MLDDYNIDMSENIFRGLNDTVSEADSDIPNVNPTALSPTEELIKKFEPFEKFIKIGHANTVSVPKNRDDIEVFLNRTGMDLFATSETNIHKNTPKSVFEIPNYRFYHKDRVGNRGGSGIYIKKEIPAKYIPIQYEHEKFEVCAVEVTINKVKVAVVSIYKSPSVNYHVYSLIFEALQALIVKYNHVVILGDLNIDFLNKETPKYKFFKSQIVEPLGLTQLIQKPTRITKNTQSLIDLILVSSPQNVKFSDVTVCPFEVDHDLIYMAYNFKKVKFKPRIITKRIMKDFSADEFKDKLNLAPWGNIYAVPQNDVDNQIVILENIFNNVLNDVAPVKSFRVTRPPSPWLTDDLKKLMEDRDKLKSAFKKNFDRETEENYKKLRNLVCHKKRSAKHQNFHKKINSQSKNSKKIHSALKTEKVVDSKKSNNNSETSFINLDILNQTFSSFNNMIVDKNKVSNEIGRIMQHSLPQTFSFQQVTEIEVLKAVKSIKTNATGIDNISAMFIKTGIDIALPFITDIINNAIRCKYFPCRWKFALIRPIPKKANPVSPTDFRPISLLPAFSKIMEKLMGDQMKKHFFEKQLLSIFQSAYTKNHSTGTVLLDITDFVFESFDNGEIVILVLLDYSKAFDCANHDLILAKTKALGFQEQALQMLSSYLSDRQQKIKVDEDESNWCKLLNGVPQGSILGPLLFTILLNDIKNAINHCHHHCYADDTQIFQKTSLQNLKECVEGINSDLNNIADFSVNNCLQINADKSHFIVLGTKSKLAQLKRTNFPPIKMNNEIITRETEVKNLGVIFDETLSFSKHISDLISNAVGRLKQAYRHKNFLSQEVRLIIVEYYVLAKINYCDILFQNLTVELKNKLAKFQNWCVKFVFGLRKYDHVSQYFKKHNILNMNQRRNMHTLTQIHKLKKGIGPKYLLCKLNSRSEIHDYNTRHKNDLVIPQSKKGYNKNKFFNKCLKEYNDIMALKTGRKLKSTGENESVFNEKDSIITFKKKLKKYFLQSGIKN